MTLIKLIIGSLFIILSFSSIPIFSQCNIKEAQELDDYKRTEGRIQEDITKYVQSHWQKSSSNFEFEIFLYYQKADVKVYKLGMNKGSITFKIPSIGKVSNCVVFYSDGSFENISPFNTIWNEEDVAFPTEFSFILKGDILSTEDKITDSEIINRQRNEAWLKDSIDLSKMPTRIVILTQKGSKEYTITTEDHLNMQCILKRYKTPNQIDKR